MLGLRRKLHDFIIWLTGGILYFYLEIIGRGYSHYSMLICGGIAFLFVGYAGQEIIQLKKNVLQKVLLILLYGSIIITFLEYITGLIVNKFFNLNVWDYSDIKYNFQGQICAAYSVLWGILSLLCVVLNYTIRKYIFDEI